MRPSDLLHGVRKAFARNRFRSLLTLLGVVIGSASIVLLAGLLQSGEQSLMQMNMEAQELDLIAVYGEQAPDKDLRRTTHNLSRYDQEALAESPLLGGSAVASESMHQAQAVWEGRHKRVRIVGGAPDGLGLYRLKVARGRFITEEDLRDRRRVCVLGYEVWEELFGRDPDLARLRLTLDDQVWSVVGVIEHKPSMDKGDGTYRWDRRALVPQTTFDAVYEPAHNVGKILVRMKGAGALQEQRAALTGVIESTLLRRHLGVKNFKVNDTRSGGQEEIIIMVIEMLLFATALLSLFVGGINIMNIMMVTVTERTREIGVRRALGATPRDILVQFVTEAGAIAAAGGLIGVAGGIGVLWLASVVLSSAFGSWPFHVEQWSLPVAIGLALVTGIAFGIAPAWRAAKLRPVEALRYE